MLSFLDNERCNSNFSVIVKKTKSEKLQNFWKWLDTEETPQMRQFIHIMNAKKTQLNPAMVQIRQDSVKIRSKASIAVH